MTAARQSCLFVLSSSNEGITAQSFAQAYNLANSNFTVQLTSPGGKNIEFINQDDSNRRWINEFRAKANSTPIALETVDAARYAALVIPDSPGALTDLQKDSDLKQILSYFVKEKTKANSTPIALETVDAARYTALVIPDSPGALTDLQKDSDLKQILSYFVKEKKPICAIGMGVAGLFSGQEEGRWLFEDYSLTTVSIYELARLPEFATLPIIPENFIKDHYAKYSCSGEVDSVHVVIDRHVITGQNVQSTIMAVQNLILMCSQKFTGRLSPRVS